MFHFTFAKLMQIRPPARILFQIFGDMFGKQNVSGVAAIHDPLRDIDASAGDVCLFVKIGDFVDRAAVNSHAHLKFRMTLERLANFQRAQNRRFRSVRKTSAPPSPVGKRSSLPSASASGIAPFRARSLSTFESARSAR